MFNPAISRDAARFLAAILLIVGLGVGAGLTPPAAAQTTDKFDAAETKVEDLARSGKTGAALTASRRLVQAARRALKQDPKLAKFLAELSLLESQTGHLAEAEAAAREALAINGAVAEPDSPLVWHSLVALAEILAKGGPDKLAEAETLLARAIAILEDRDGPGNPEATKLQQKLADLLDQRGRKAEADKLRASSVDAAKAWLDNAASNAAPVTKEAEAPSPSSATTAPSVEADKDSADEQAAPKIQHKFKKESIAPSKPGAGAAEPAPQPSPPSATPVPTTSAPATAPDYHVVDVFFGTNRVAVDGGPRLTFNDAEANTLTLGEARITVPANHVVPEVERPWTLNVPFTQIVLIASGDDPKRYFTVQSIEKLPEDGFIAQARAHLAGSRTYKDQALVFVHGYYNKFDDALYRTAQIAFDMQFDGATFLFSWPSAGTIDAYSSDRVKAANSGGQLRAFLDLVAHKTGAKRITVIAHSMGNLPLLEALDETLPGPVPSPDAAIDDIVLAAPDVGRDEFTTMTGHLGHIRGGVTLYAASNDLALTASRTINGENRAGDTWPGGPLLLPHVDTIDATGTSLQMFRLNHFYVAQSSAVLCDVEQLLQTGLHPPDARTRLIAPVTAASGALYYTFRP